MKIFRIVVCGAVAVGGLGACSHKAPKEQMPEPRIAVVKAYRQELPTRMQFVGQTYSQADVTIQPRVSGYLLSTHYEQGMPVKKGQLLFKLDPEPMRLEVTRAEAALASAKSQLVEAQNNYNRSVPLARINAISQSALDQATATLASARANLRSAEAALRSANLNLSYTTIYAPSDGVIGETVGSVGDYVGPGTNNTVLNTISVIDSIYVYISIPTAKYLSIVERDSLDRPLYDNTGLLTDVDMTLADGTPYPYKGVYKFTERAVDNRTGAVVIRVLFPNPEHYLKPGQYVKVDANVGGGKRIVLVPQRAVMQSQGVNSVYVVGRDSTVAYRQVTLGDTYGREWGILEGLEPGEQVLTEGFQKVRSGMKIVPLLQPAPPSADTLHSQI
ncbi:efflux RND transporter periplasmic adaptor subunit [uncultured Rikenella sp.]|uniref:efflux RND transporter periplasmic adaptor subunit n=1 Tax=uncultured Rikenella sp. TaxID=368003 RepID=UPI00261303AA|nr:efflux RND transporter periplasmic adaptor subunit [uncultured Rikenella sp.]